MEIMYERVAGLDVHKQTVVACVRAMARRKVVRECRTFATTTDGLASLLAWLSAAGCSHVAMEATGVYWTPVWHVQRIQKTIEEANIKLDSVITDILGVSGRRMIEAMIAGVRDPYALAALAHRSLKASPQQLVDALRGRLTDHHRFLLKLHLGQRDALDAAIRAIDREVDRRIERIDQNRKDGEIPLRALILLLSAIPGVSTLSAITILSEIGRDMSRFPTAGHLIAWAGLCPGQNESAGKQKSSRLRKGAPWLKTMLIQCAWAAKRQKNSYYMAQFYRLQARRGPQKAICAVAASLLTAIYHMVKNSTGHHDLGVDYFDRRSPQAKAKRLVAQLSKLGFEVTLQPTATAA